MKFWQSVKLCTWLNVCPGFDEAFSSSVLTLWYPDLMTKILVMVLQFDVTNLINCVPVLALF